MGTFDYLFKTTWELSNIRLTQNMGTFEHSFNSNIGTNSKHGNFRLSLTQTNSSD